MNEILRRHLFVCAVLCVAFTACTGTIDSPASEPSAKTTTTPSSTGGLQGTANPQLPTTPPSSTTPVPQPPDPVEPTPPMVEANLTDSIGLRLKLVPAGTFAMGSSTAQLSRCDAELGGQDWYGASCDSEGPQHQVKISKAFYIGIYEVTVGQFDAFVKASGYSPSSGSQWRDGRGEDYPVTEITYADDLAFMAWLTQKEGVKYRHPTEAEWEYACRAGTSTYFSWGDDQSKMSQYAWTGNNSGGSSHKVGQLKPNAWGLYDMEGNVYEHTSDGWSMNYYAQSPMVDPHNTSGGGTRVVRSGSHGTQDGAIRCGFRGSYSANWRNNKDGFRVVREVSMQ